MEKREEAAQPQAHTPIIDETEKKKGISIWRQRNIQKQREAARQKLDQIRDTAGFEDNMDAMREFEKLIACPIKSYVTSQHSHIFNRHIADNADESNA